VEVPQKCAATRRKLVAGDAIVGGRVNSRSGPGGFAHRAARQSNEFREHGFAGIDQLFQCDAARLRRAIAREQGDMDERRKVGAVILLRRLDRAPAQR
jgi:hypothetical protein